MKLTAQCAVTIVAYAICAGEFLWRFLKHRPLAKHTKNRSVPPPMPAPLTSRLKVLIVGMAFNLLFLLIRCVFLLPSVNPLRLDGTTLTSQFQSDLPCD
jgi:hypothetical protein